MIAGGTVVYVSHDGGFHIDGYTWLAMYVFFMVSQNVLYKRVLDTVPMSRKTACGLHFAVVILARWGT